MSAVRRHDYLTVTDTWSDSVTFSPGPDDGVVAAIDVHGRIVYLDLDDTLAVLSFLADAAGVERYVPGGAS